MYGVLYENPYNERIGQIVKTSQFQTAWQPQDLQPMRLVGGSRMIGGVERRFDPENNVYRPRGAVYVSPAPTNYIVPYSVVSYPQFNAVELAEVDKLKSGNHPPLSAGAATGGRIRISRKVKKDFKKIGRVLKPVGRELLKVGKEVASELGRELLKKGKEVALERMDQYMEGMQDMEGDGFKQEMRNLNKQMKKGKGIKKDLKKVGRVLKKTFTSKPAKEFYKGVLDVVAPAAAIGISSYTGMPPEVASIGTEALKNVAKKRIGKGRKVAGVGIYEGNGVISGGASGAKSGGVSKIKKRGNLIKKLMKDNKMSLAEASKFIKDNNLM